MNKLERQLQKAINQQMPNPDDMIESLWNTPVTPLPFADEIVRQEAPDKAKHTELQATASGDEEETAGVARFFTQLKGQLQSHMKVAYSIASIALLLAIGGGFYQTQYNTEDSLVAIDVNPSVELTTNKKDQVIKITAKNEDATEIISKMTDYKNKDVDLVVENLLDRLQDHGYLQEAENVILVSVSNKETAKAQTLQNRIEKEIDHNMKKQNKKVVVIKQDMTELSALKKLAKKYHISVGKLQFIQKIIAVNPVLKLKDLAKMSMTELNSLARQYGIFSDQSIHTNEPETTTEQEDLFLPLDEDEDYSDPYESDEDTTEVEEETEEAGDDEEVYESEEENTTQIPSGRIDENDYILPDKNENIAPYTPNSEADELPESTTQSMQMESINIE